MVNFLINATKCGLIGGWLLLKDGAYFDLTLKGCRDLLRPTT